MTLARFLWCFGSKCLVKSEQSDQFQPKKIFRPRSHYSVFVMIHFCCVEATRSHYSVFVQKRSEKPPFLSVHIDPSDNKCGAKDFRFCAFALVRILKRFQKSQFLCIHIDSERFRKPPFL